MAKKIKYYVIWQGREPGIYTDWSEAKAQVDGYVGARYKGFETEQEAHEAYEAGAPSLNYRSSSKDKMPATANPIKRSIAVDAACSGNPGVMEYRGVSLWDNNEIFRLKYDIGTNNIGEFLAIVHALALLAKKGFDDIPIYSDSKIAMTWVKAKTCRTKLELSPRTAELLSVVKRAEQWLKNNTYTNEIIKWPTDVWGEIPADFGRK